MFSATEALFSIHFLRKLHQHKVPNFNLVHTLSLILKSIVPCIHVCTEIESENLGIFFSELFSLINRWSKPDVWTNECENYTGFAKVIGANNTFTI